MGAVAHDEAGRCLLDGPRIKPFTVGTWAYDQVFHPEEADDEVPEEFAERFRKKRHGGISPVASDLLEAKLENLIGDRACDSDPLDDASRQDGIDRSNRRKLPTQDSAEPVYATLARRALLHLDTVAAPHPRPLGSTTHRTSLALSNSLTSRNFDRGSSQFPNSICTSEKTRKSLPFNSVRESRLTTS
jgi:hypothetical protein